MVNHFIGSKKQIEARPKIEKVIKVITSPIWIPFWLVTIICYLIVCFMEESVNPIYEGIVDRLSEFVVRNFIK